MENKNQKKSKRKKIIIGDSMPSQPSNSPKQKPMVGIPAIGSLNKRYGASDRLILAYYNMRYYTAVYNTLVRWEQKYKGE